MNSKVDLAIGNFNCVIHCSYFDIPSLKENSLEDPGVNKNETIFLHVLRVFCHYSSESTEDYSWTKKKTSNWGT